MKEPDEKIKKDIVDRLYEDERVNATDVDVEVADGTVTLLGTVPSYAERQAIWDDTWDVPGVTYVRNQIDIRRNTPSPLDAELEAEILKAFAEEPDLDYTDYNIEVNNGFIRIEGNVDNICKKNNVLALLGRIQGVIDIESRITVTPTEDIVDEAIAKSIADELAQTAMIDMNSIDIKVERGEVILTGTVPSATARSEAAQIVHDTFGVKHLNNQLKIKGVAK